MDASQIAILIGAVCGGLGAVAGGLATAWVLIRRASSEVNLLAKKQNIEVQKQVIEQLASRVEALEGKLDKKENDHRECERKLGILEGRVEQLSKEMDKALQRHDAKNWEQSISMKDETIKELERRLAEYGVKLPEKP